MVAGSRVDGGTHIVSAGVRQILKSIKEVVGNNHSDADIYVVLKESNMDPNETAQKLLFQDTFHEVKRKRDRKKENPVFTGSTASEIRSYIEHGAEETSFNADSNRNIQRQNYSRATLPDAGIGCEFRVVRDNRANQASNREIKPVQTSTSDKAVVSTVPIKRGTADNKLSIGYHSSRSLNGTTYSQHKHPSNGNFSGTIQRGSVENGASSQMEGVKPNISLTHMSSDPVHVPYLYTRPAGKVGAIKREVGVVGARRQSAESFTKISSSQSSSFSNSQMGQVQQDGTNSKGSLKPESSNSRSDQNAVSESHKSRLLNRPFSSNRHINRGHQKAIQWKPKLNQKSIVNRPGVIGSPSEAVSLSGRSEELGKEESQLQEKASRLNISDNVIIAAHIRVSDTDRNRLTFGSLDADLTYSNDLGKESPAEPPGASLSVLVTEPLSDAPVGGKQLDMVNGNDENSGSKSPGSGATLNHQMTDKRDSSPAQDLENYSNVGLVQGNSTSCTPSQSHEQQDARELPGLSAYDPQTGYSIPYFTPAVDESVHGQGAQEALGSHATNSIPASSNPMLQHKQQLQHVPQMYPQVHVSHFANLMPYRHLHPPIYVPPMAMPGYSSNLAYPHPSSGSNYLLMPGGSSHLSANGLKYGIQQFKPVPTGSASGFGNFTSPTGYAINTPGVIGGGTGFEDSSRLKYKDTNLYVPNQQEETSEMWMSPRDLPALRSDSYYNMAGQTPHAAYLPSHTGYGSFNAAPEAAQSSHMQFQALYHPLQPATMANPQHLGSAIAAPTTPGAQVGAYQQPQYSHLNWNGNF